MHFAITLPSYDINVSTRFVRGFGMHGTNMSIGFFSTIYGFFWQLCCIIYLHVNIPRGKTNT